MRRKFTLIPPLLLALIGGCADVPQPVLEPSARMPAGEAQDAARDLRLCRQAVRDAAPVSIQPRWIPPIVAPNGVVLGTVEAPHPVWPSRAAYRRDLERCLISRGYEIRGWQ